MNIRKILAAALFAAASAVLCTGCGTDPVSLVKNSALQYDGSLTIGQAVSGMENKKRAEWSAWRDKQGRQYVTVKITAQDPERMLFSHNDFDSKYGQKRELECMRDNSMYSYFGWGYSLLKGANLEIIKPSAEAYQNYIDTVPEEKQKQFFILHSCTLVLNFLITNPNTGEFSCIEGTILLPFSTADKDDAVPFTIPVKAENEIVMIYNNLSFIDSFGDSGL
ncbi:MAG: hypothetical protein M0P01_13445 [Treponema sp.]|nr:hypothetical protein [Treponema sp.]